MRIGAARTLINGVNIAHSQTYYTEAVPVGIHGINIGIQVKGVSSAGSPKFTVSYEQSNFEPAVLTAGGASDANYVPPEGAVNVCTDRILETYMITSVSVPPAKYFRWKITTAADSNDDSVFTLIHFGQEE